jgi:hypothetical protein
MSPQALAELLLNGSKPSGSLPCGITAIMIAHCVGENWDLEWNVAQNNAFY